MNKICLFALLIAAASAHIAADLSNFPVTRDNLNCLASKGVTKAIFEIYNERAEIKRYFLNNYIIARDAGMWTVDAIVIVNDNLTASEVSANVTSALPVHFNGTVWLQVFDSPNLWSQEDKSKRVSYLSSLVLGFKRHGVKAGVYSDAKAWESAMGDTSIGSDALKATPVWYVNENKVPNFDDFSYAGFGNWKRPSLKSFEKYPEHCDTLIASFNFYETK